MLIPIHYSATVQWQYKTTITMFEFSKFVLLLVSLRIHFKLINFFNVSTKRKQNIVSTFNQLATNITVWCYVIGQTSNLLYYVVILAKWYTDYSYTIIIITDYNNYVCVFTLMYMCQQGWQCPFMPFLPKAPTPGSPQRCTAVGLLLTPWWWVPSFSS